jgi:hypothetical protein
MSTPFSISAGSSGGCATITCRRPSNGRCVARHERCYGRQQEILDLKHDLDVLEQKPGALAGSKPLAHWRELGHWPTSYDQIWKGLMVRQGRQAGTKAMIELLQLGRRYGPPG